MSWGSDRGPAPKLADGMIEIAKCDMPTGEGKWLRYKDATDNHGMEAFIQAGDVQFRCWVWLMTENTTLLDTCKSFVAK